MQNEVVLLGTKGGPAIRTGSSNPTSSLLVLDGRSIVVDCGLGVTRGLVDQGVQLKAIELIFVTHLHSDHYLELGPLLHTAWTAGLKTPVEIWGPKGLETYWNGFLQSMDADIQLRIEDEGRPDLGALARFHVIEEGTFFDRDGLQVAALRNLHPPLVDTYALSFRQNDTHVVFSGDTRYFPELADFAKDADLLIHEAMLEDALPALMARIGNADDRLMRHLKRSHTSAADAARIATGAGVRALALHHLLPADDPDFTHADWVKAVTPHFDGPLYIGSDGLRIEI
ncbi:MAG: MBL fold metallo-hydrolase [Silicimonas sp.]|nr:MBL fold metallo-hydrolase [Silicimonas sp.]